jgi:galactonate dehydratase
MDLPRDNSVFNTRERINHLTEECGAAREGVGKDGDWVIDFHQRFDLPDAIRGCNEIESLAPFFVEDPVRTEAFLQDLPILRNKVNVPLAAGEEWGNRWDFNPLVERHDIDFVRATLPNVGGITEMMKIAALCETHFIGIVPHFTGPIATAALVNCLGTYSGPVLMEYNYQGHTLPHLPVCLDFKNGKLYPNERPGIGVELDFKQLKQVAEITEPVTARAQTYFRTDGSITNW